MAIEPLKKVTIVNTKEGHRRLIKTINNLGIMEVVDIKSTLKEDIPLNPPKADTQEADSNINKIDFILNLINNFLPEKESFIKSLTPIPIVTSEDELYRILNEYNLEKHYKYAVELDETYRNAERVISEIDSELEDLKPLMDLDIDLEEFYSTKRIKILIGYVAEKKLEAIEQKDEIWQWIAWEVISKEDSKAKKDRKDAGARIKVVFAFLNNYEEDVKKILSELNFEEIALPKRKEKVKERMAELEEDKENYKNKIAEVSEKINVLLEDDTPEETRRKLLILKAYWNNIKNRQLALMKGAEGKWVYVVSGFIRAKDEETLKKTVQKDFPESIITIEDPQLDDDVPVSISVPYLLKPIQLLTEMFGLPYYRSFDPTPFMQINFYLFFGICFSDVCYGIMLALMGAYLSKKTKLYKGINNLSRMLLYGGLSSIIFGALTGSWFGDLYKPEYLGEGNFLYMLQQRFVVIDPMSKTIIALIIALGLGVLNQFFGITLKMYDLYRKKDFIGVISDGLCWIITLTGLLIMAGKVFTEIPKSIFNTGVFLFIIGAIGLILTQGREIKSKVGKFAGGLISLYGIVGSYGITAFIGDTLSYCRLLALGLTTSIVAMAFNLMAGMLKGIPYIGIILFIIVLVIGHVFNFLISALGAFVHSMRLIFVEFFGRFYEGGARPFQPLGFDSNLCIIKKENKATI